MQTRQHHGPSLRLKARRWAHAAFLLGAALLAGCGGGGGESGGGSNAGGDAVALRADVYPLSTGDRRTWRISTGTHAGTTRSERVGDAVQLGGRTVLTVRSDDGAVEYVERSVAGVVAVPGPHADPFTLAAGPVEVLRFGQIAGTTVELFNRTLETDLDGDGRVDSVDLHVESTFTGYESVATAVGTFTGAARMRTVGRITLRYAGLPASGVVTVTADEWFAPGVGLVRSVTTTTGVGMPAEIDTRELVAYGVGSRRSETVAPALLSSSPAADMVAPASTTVQLDFSEALDPLTLDSPGGLALVNAAGQPVATSRFVTEAATRITLTPQAVLPDGRYEIRLGSALTDLANNALPASVRAFTVDTLGPRLVASVPAQGSDAAATTGAVLLRFDEPVFAPGGDGQVALQITDFSGTQNLAGVIQGTDIVATLATPLQRNREYSLRLATHLTDAAGNAVTFGAIAVHFRTDPGPLARPAALMDNVEVSAVALGDVDGDGRSDIVFAAQQIGASDYFIAARLQQADGHYGAALRLFQLLPSPICLPRSISLADVNGDGHADMALAGCDDLTVLIRQAGGGFVAEVPFAGLRARRYSSVDLDGDGRSEIVATVGGELRYLRRDAAGAWRVVLALDGGGPYPHILDFRLTDLNGDGVPDLVWVRIAPDNASYELAWALRLGSGFGAVRSQAISAAIDSSPALAVADVTGDGRPDVLLLLRLGDVSQLAVLAQMADAGLAAPVLYASYFSAATVDTADVDGDGRLDVLVTHSAGRQLGVYLQAADGSLQPERRFETGYAYYDYTDAVVVADLNADGRTDVVVGVDVLLGRTVAGAWPASVPAPGPRVALGGASPIAHQQVTVKPAEWEEGFLHRMTRVLRRAPRGQPAVDARR